MNNKTYNIEQVDELSDKINDLIHNGHVQTEGSIIGALQAYTAFSEIYVDDIWVSSSFRCNGIGKKLLAYLENKFKGKALALGNNSILIGCSCG